MRSTYCLFILLATTLLLASTGRAESAPNSEVAHKQLDQILQHPLYQEWKLRQEGHLPRANVEISEGLRHWLSNRLNDIGDFFKWLFRSHARSSQSMGKGSSEMLPTMLKVVAWTVLGIALIFLAIHIARLMDRPGIAASTAQVLTRQQVNDALEAGDALALGTAQWIDEAQRLAGAQNFRAVYRALYLALLSGLHSAGKIEHNRNSTNWFYVQHYRGPALERITFGELTDLFDHVWYGRHISQGGDLEQLRDKVLALTGAGAQPR
jgi:hypothetical protein